MKDYPNCVIIKIGTNTEKSPRDLKILDVIQNSGEKPSANDSHEKIEEKVNNNNNTLK